MIAASTKNGAKFEISSESTKNCSVLRGKGKASKPVEISVKNSIFSNFLSQYSFPNYNLTSQTTCDGQKAGIMLLDSIYIRDWSSVTRSDEMLRVLRVYKVFVNFLSIFWKLLNPYGQSIAV